MCVCVCFFFFFFFFFVPFACAGEKVFIKTYCIESRLVTGPSNVLFAGVYVCTFQPRTFTGLGNEGKGLKSFHANDIRLAL